MSSRAGRVELKDKEVANILGITEKATNKCYQRLINLYLAQRVSEYKSLAFV